MYELAKPKRKRVLGVPREKSTGIGVPSSPELTMTHVWVGHRTTAPFSLAQLMSQQ